MPVILSVGYSTRSLNDRLVRRLALALGGNVRNSAFLGQIPLIVNPSLGVATKEKLEKLRDAARARGDFEMERYYEHRIEEEFPEPQGGLLDTTTESKGRWFMECDRFGCGWNKRPEPTEPRKRPPLTSPIKKEHRRGTERRPIATGTSPGEEPISRELQEQIESAPFRRGMGPWGGLAMQTGGGMIAPATGTMPAGMPATSFAMGVRYRVVNRVDH